MASANQKNTAPAPAPAAAAPAAAAPAPAPAAPAAPAPVHVQRQGTPPSGPLNGKLKALIHATKTKKYGVEISIPPSVSEQTPYQLTVKDAEQSKKFFEVMVASSTHFNIEADWPEKLGNDDFGVSNIVIQLNKGGPFSQH